MSEIINYTRLTTSDKLEDKFVTCQAYTPQDIDQAKLGTIFAQLEIECPWFPTSQVGQAIINTLIKEYYRGSDSSDLVNFEEAIKKVNESLAHIAQGGETEWIGKLSGVLVLVNGSDIHFAQTGKSHSYLYRTGKINHITEGLESSDPPHPLKTFSNLTSGSLQDEDKIIIANDSFFEAISPTELRLVITSMPPSLSAIECAKILQSHGSQDANAIFIELTTKDKLANLLPEQKIEAVYLDQQILTLGKLSKNAFNNIASSSKDSAKKILSVFSHVASNKIKPLAKKGFELSKEKAKVVIENSKKTSEIIEGSEQPEFMDSNTKDASLINKFKISTISSLTKMKNKVRRPLIKVGFYTQKKSKMYLYLLLAVALCLTGTVFFSLKNKKDKVSAKEAELAYQQIVSTSGEAEVLLANNNANEAAIKYLSVVDLEKKVSNTSYQDQSKELIAKANKKVNELIKLKEISPLSVGDLPDKGILAVLKSDVFAVSKQDLLTGKSDAKTFTKVSSLGLPISLVASMEELGLLSGVSNNKLISFDNMGNELKTSSLTFGSVKYLITYGSNAYLADTSENKLWKTTYHNGEFSEKNSYFKDEVNISKISSFAIDGSVYTLSESGAVTRYSRGTKVSEFQLNLPANQPISLASKLFASEDTDDMLSLVKTGDEFRILKTKKDGELLVQYKLKDIRAVDSMSADNSLETIFISSENKVYSFTLN